MKTVFESGDILMFQKDYGLYSGGQIIILGSYGGSPSPTMLFDVLGDICKDDEAKPTSVTASHGWLETLFKEGIIKHIGEKK